MLGAFFGHSVNKVIHFTDNQQQHQLTYYKTCIVYIEQTHTQSSHCPVAQDL